MKVKIFYFLLLSLISILGYPQGKQANYWYFGYHAGLNFNTGSPAEVLSNGQTWVGTMGACGCASISDNNGNLLFYTDGMMIWNKNHQLMPNGQDIGRYSTQGAIIIPDLTQPNLYYIFNLGYGSPVIQADFIYSIVDMNLDNGNGDVIAGKKSNLILENTTYNLSAVHHSNGHDVWIITHGFNDNQFYCFLLTDEGLNLTPVVSLAGTIYDSQIGFSKFSPNGKWIASTQYLHDVYGAFFELFKFNNSTGEVNNQDVAFFLNAYGIEFSPDNKKFYSKGYTNSFYQFDITLSNAAEILASKISVYNDFSTGGSLQLAPDGQIYCCTDPYILGVIHDPNKKAPFCNFQKDYLPLAEGTGLYEGFPTFLQSYLNDPEFATLQHCLGQQTQFNIVNLNGIDSVNWKFNDPGLAPNDTSTLFSPEFQFSSADTFYVELTVYSGFIEKTVIDTVIIYPIPKPVLGNDTAYCDGDPIDITLDAGPGQLYSWNGAFPTTNQTFKVTGPGMYTVRVNDNGCFGSDTIFITQHIAPVVDTTNYYASFASCTIPDGSITGITVTGGGTNVSYEWQNSTGGVVSNNIDLLGMPAGIYTLNVRYGDNCTVEPYVFEIENAVKPQITSVIPTHDHCGQQKGKLLISAVSNLGDPLWYSINGVDFYASYEFTGLPADLYTVTVKDENECIDEAQVTIQNIPGPSVTDSTSTPENGYAANGTITITAEGDSVYYSLDGGAPQSSGSFTGLSQGDYTITITDKWGCIRTVQMTVDRINGTILSANAGDDYKCKLQQAYSTLTADNFINVKEFTAVLEYDNSRLSCTGYNPANDFPDIVVTDFSGRVEVEWSSNAPKTLSGTVQLVDLVFQTIEWGSADIKWDTAFCVFKDEYGNIIQSSLDSGLITINNPPELINQTEKTIFCEGERAELIVSKTGGTGPFNYNWEIPGNFTVNDTTIIVDSITVSQSGSYNLKVTDLNNCTASLSIPVSVVALPTANFPTGNDTIFFEEQTTLTAQQGYASYLWNNGDTTYFTIVDEEGEYSVLIQTNEGCQNLESVFMSDTYIDIKVPTAFTPNGDGLNDTFKPLVDLERIRQYHISIYNKWGQLTFETNDPLKGWEGNDLIGGVYTWVIDYKNRVGKNSQIKGSVALIK